MVVSAGFREELLHFKYPGSVFVADGRLDVELNRRRQGCGEV